MLAGWLVLKSTSAFFIYLFLNFHGRLMAAIVRTSFLASFETNHWANTPAAAAAPGFDRFSLVTCFWRLWDAGRGGRSRQRTLLFVSYQTPSMPRSASSFLYGHIFMDSLLFDVVVVVWFGLVSVFRAVMNVWLQMNLGNIYTHTHGCETIGRHKTLLFKKKSQRKEEEEESSRHNERNKRERERRAPISSSFLNKTRPIFPFISLTVSLARFRSLLQRLHPLFIYLSFG